MYETDLTDFQWQVIQEILPDTRRRKHSLRLIVNALLYLTKSGCQWRLLPREFPAFPLVYYYFRRWQADGRWAALNQALVRRHRQRAAPSRQPNPRVAVLDAQSIKCSERGVLDQGFDGHKKIQGRKHQLVVDTDGLLLAAHVEPAHENDRVGGKAALQKLAQQRYERPGRCRLPRRLAQWTREHCGWRLETAPGLTGSARFTPVPTRWVVERTISWLQWDRRLSRDYECESAAAEATIFLASIRHLIRKF
ncbi:IS5 family transposase [Hymenobacter coccineus]|uniref:Uncharacterized protein n=1 Tax=Hymenobacter coccineus TaxID=1908235 RepID=A0A1G1TKU5_9BACT|nr:IS5 family transposase [Hymenobacter coccineus]OGX91492.1 hypothetical protein BEN49_04785 [Hymenobacter coccineus]